ncbi:MAG: glycosyltransferase family 4 protein [bacterium]|nr:glycosyltransferase family 4 protein [bacterium]
MSDNFPPESNAPAIRTHEHLREWVKAGHDITVVTCAPNFPRGQVYEGYRNRIFQREELDGIKIVRVWTYISSNEGSLKRILDYVSFMLSAVITSCFLRRPDVVIGTSPQFFAAAAAWMVAKLKRRPFVFELRDLWPETILAVGAMKKGRLVQAIEDFATFLYRQADLVVPVTEPFARHLEKVGVDPKRIVVVTNGIEPGQHRPQIDPEQVRDHWGIPRNAFTAGYIGTLGLCHGLSAVLEAAELLKGNPRFHFVLMGDGADRDELEQIARERKLDNVTLIPGQPRQSALELLNAVDVSLVVLKNSPLFETVIPSKIFEAMELRTPILIGVRGESRRIVVEEVGCGIDFPPEDADAMVRSLHQLAEDTAAREKLAARGGEALQERFRRSALAARMLRAVQAVAEGRNPNE